MENFEIATLRPKVDRVVAVYDGRELGRGVFVRCNVWMSEVLLDGKSKVSPYPFMNDLLIREEDYMKANPKTKVQRQPKTKKQPRIRKGKKK